MLAPQRTFFPAVSSSVEMSLMAPLLSMCFRVQLGSCIEHAYSLCCGTPNGVRDLLVNLFHTSSRAIVYLVSNLHHYAARL
jgi:hypothetical protein